jgi:hypothetical protein
MTMQGASFPWLSLLALGAMHGINPAMGWLFAVARGLQERNRRALWGALGPLALGHGLAIAAAIAAAATLGRIAPPSVLRWLVAAALLAVGLDGLRRHRHVQLKGMRVSGRELATWSFLMASAHGAGLMLLPLLVGVGGAAAQPNPYAAHAAHLLAASAVPSLLVTGPVALGLQATLLHTAGYLLVTGLVALTVYRKLGLRMLRTMWINLDLIWGAALVVTGAVAVLA